MRKLLLVALAPCLLLTSSCAAVSALSAAPAVIESVTNVISSVGNKVEIRGTQALIIAEEFYQPINRSALGVVQSGRLSRDQLLWLRATNREITNLLERGKASSDEGIKATIAAQVLQKAFQIRSLVH